MTGEKMIRIVRGGLLKTDGQSIDSQAKEVVDRIRLALEMEAEEERELGQVLHPTLDVKAPDSYIAPPPPASRPAEIKSSLVILPDSLEAKEFEKKPVTPLRLTRSGKTQEQDELAPKRSIESLMEMLSAHPEVPITMDVTPPGSNRDVRLTRHLEAGQGFNAVKVTYIMDGMNQPIPSGKHLLSTTLESEIQPMALDIPISEVFFTWEEDLKIHERMATIRKNAEKCYAPRPDRIQSRTPVRQGALKFSELAPHEEV